MEGKSAIETIHLSVAAKLSNLAGIRDFVRTAIIPCCSNEDFLYELILAVEEAITNIIMHGYQGINGIITLMIVTNESCVEILIQDDAPAFDPTSVPAPRLDLPLELRPLGGLGIHLIRKYSEKMSYQRTPSGMNELKIVKSFPIHSESAGRKFRTDRFLEKSMNITIEQIQAKAPVTIVSLAGVLDVTSYRAVIDRATQLFSAGMRALILDLSGLTFLSSSGIVALHSIALLMRGEQLPDTDEGWNTFHAISHFVEEGCEFEKNVKLLSPQPRVLKTLETTGFDHLFRVFTNRESAIASFQEL